MEFPVCPTCVGEDRLIPGSLVPLSDTSKAGTEIRYKMWVCTNPECKSSIISRGGDPYWSRKSPGVE